MKVIVMNYSGNVGKSTVCRHLLQPRMNGAELFTVETVNSDDYKADEVERLRGKQFGELLPKLLVPNKSAIVDVGASNAEAFIQRLAQYGAAHKYIDYFVIPTAAKPKQIADTIATIDTLTEIGVPAVKIRVLLNMLDPDSEATESFARLFAHAKAKKSFIISVAAAMQENELYTKLNGTSLTIAGLLDDADDLDGDLKSATDDEEVAALTQQLAARLLAENTVGELDAAFKALFK